MRISDWSSDVCSSDLKAYAIGLRKIAESIVRGNHCAPVRGNAFQGDPDFRIELGHSVDIQLGARSVIGAMRRVGLHKAIGNVARIDHAIAQTLPCMRIDVTLSMRVVTMALLLMLRVVSIAGGVACTTHHLIRAQDRKSTRLNSSH